MPERHAVVDVEGLSKTFRVPRQHVMTLKERALHPFRRTEFDELHALSDVSFQILEGEFFGVVGRNGSGKSTLLKCLAGIYGHDSGRIRIAGRLAPFIELGVGFNPDLAALDNVVINGVMMGLTPREARARFGDVIAFAELEEFLDLKLKNYSSGMQVRLAFALMVQSDADLMLVDEVLAVGDASFQQKCFDAFHRLHGEGRTIVLVTHDMPTVERFCDRAALFEAGRLSAVGDPAEVGRRYLALNFAERASRARAPEHEPRASIAEVWVEADGRRIDGVAHGEPFELHALVEAREALEDVEIRLALSNENGVLIFAAGTAETYGAETVAPGERVRVRVTLENPLVAGRYFVTASIRRHQSEEVLSRRERACDFMVFGGDHAAGLVSLEHRVEMERELVEARP
jgi:ABC-type polysaccharide/polyol phosphate transport system ATPase subunit